ncbi:Death-like domain-containing protein [Dioscorea alata]|nr:Death-like domain-containing protein [Dioscorea alata]
MQEVAGERGGYLHGRGALDSDDLLYLKEQMEAEEDAERLLRRTEKRAFAAFKKAASIADQAPATLPLPLRVEPKPKSGIRQQDLLKNVVEIRPKRHRVSSPSDQAQNNKPSSLSDAQRPKPGNTDPRTEGKASCRTNSIEEVHKPLPVTSQSTERDISSSRPTVAQTEVKTENSVGGLLGLAYESSDED